MPRRTTAETPAEASFLLPAIRLYRAERAAALARGAKIDEPHPHPFAHFRDGNPNYTWKPAIRVGDGCYCVVAN